VKLSSKAVVYGLAVIEEKWIKDVSGNWWQQQNNNNMVANLLPRTLELDFPRSGHRNLFTKRLVPTILSDFPNTQIELDKNELKITITAPANKIQEVEKQVRARFQDVIKETKDVTFDQSQANNLNTKFNENALLDQMRSQLQKMGIVEDLGLSFSAKRQQGLVVRLECSKMFIPILERLLKVQLGLTPIAYNPPSNQDPIEIIRTISRTNPQLAAVLDANADSVAIVNRPEFQKFPLNARIMLGLSHFITHHTALFIYGGFIRDFLIKGETHGEMDLDVGFDAEFGKVAGINPPTTVQAADLEWQRVIQWLAALGVQVNARNNKGPHVKEVIFVTNTGERFSAELVDISHFRTRNGLPDADVNSLRILPINGETRLVHKFPDGNVGGTMARILEGQNGTMERQCGSIQTIVANIQAKKLRVVNPVSFDQNRRTKFTARGWAIIDQ